MFFLIPIPLFPHDTVEIRYSVETNMYNSDTMIFDPFSILILMIVALAALPVPLRLPSCSWIRSSIPVIYASLYHSWMLEPLVVQIKVIFSSGYTIRPEFSVLVSVILSDSIYTVGIKDDHNNNLILQHQPSW